jgi:hypothetical protein
LFVPFGPDHLSPQLPSQNMPYNFAWYLICMWNLVSNIKGGYGQRGFQNKVLRKIFRSKWGKVTGDWRNLLNEDLCDLYTKHFSSN